MAEISILNAECQLRLVAAILGATEPQNEITEQLKKFDNLLNVDYAEFAGREATFPDDGGALRRLQKVHSELKQVAQFPMLFTKNIVAVAGGFSSGKSSFLNTFFNQSEIKLSVDMDPTTAIPTLIVPGKYSKITAYTPDGRQGDIPIEIFSKIDHALIGDLHFNLRSIMPYITVSVPFSNFAELDNICFIDTPGYDASGKDTSDDANVAYDSLMNANSIIWAVPVDAGEIKQNDLNVLNKILSEDSNKKIYIICTKSDSRMPNQVQDVMRKFKATLDDEGIDIEGISAITAISGELQETLLEDEETSLFEFLKAQNKQKVNSILRCKELTDCVNEVFSNYIKSIQTDIENYNERKQKISRMKIEFEKFINEVDQKASIDIDFDLDFYDLLDDRTSVDNENIKIADQIKRDMSNVIRSVFPELKCPSCEKKIENDSSFCSFCGTNIFGNSLSSINKCLQCGKDLEDSSPFCPYCGVKL